MRGEQRRAGATFDRLDPVPCTRCPPCVGSPAPPPPAASPSRGSIGGRAARPSAGCRGTAPSLRETQDWSASVSRAAVAAERRQAKECSKMRPAGWTHRAAWRPRA